jgi:hypothetical protein
MIGIMGMLPLPLSSHVEEGTDIKDVPSSSPILYHKPLLPLPTK